MRRLAFIGAAMSCAAAPALRARALEPDAAQQRLRALERRTGGRLGVCAIDSGTNRQIRYRAFEPFPMCSTFKFLLAAAVLARVDAGKERLDRRIAYGTGDLIEHAPVTAAHVADGSMTVKALCAAAIEASDNTAANLLIASLGGRDGYNNFARSIGDRFTQLDRTEPALNEALPGDTRDCTTPHAMARDVEIVLLGTPLTAASRALLESWLLQSQTGAARLRAGLPSSWRIGDKTGTGERGTSNDVAIAWPPNRVPITIAAYLTGATVSSDARDAALATVARIVSETLV
jgi:beta-lactamase class A